MAVQIIIADVFDGMAELESESVHCVVTSPPYWGLRCYGVDGQIGQEPTLAEHIDVMVRVFAEVHRVLRKDGTLWLNYGDCYATAPNGRSAADTKAKDDRTFRDKPFSTVGDGLKPKDLCMIPNRLAIALQDWGWWVRSEIIWHKKNPMPESIKDRPTSSHEKIWLLSKSERYFYDHEAVRTPAAESSIARWSQNIDAQEGSHRANGPNLRNVWSVATKPFSEAHFATFPPDLIVPCIKAGTSEHGCCSKCHAPWVRETTAATGGNRDWQSGGGETGKAGKVKMGQKAWNDYRPATTIGWKPSCNCNAEIESCTVLDIFGGAGTTGLVADRLGRDAVLIELNPEYADMARNRIDHDAATRGQGPEKIMRGDDLPLLRRPANRV